MVQTSLVQGRCAELEEALLCALCLILVIRDTKDFRTRTIEGKTEREEFRLYDVDAIFRLPWRWPLGAGKWKLETGLITSVGLLEAAGDAGVMATMVPDLILTGWNEIVSFDAGAGVGVFSRYQFGSQDFGGPAQFIAAIGIRFSPFTHSYAGFRLLHFSDAGLYGSGSLGVDLFVFEAGYKF